MFVVILMTFICGISTFTTTVNAASGGYAIKPGGESNDNVNIDGGNYVITGEPGKKVDLQLIVMNKENKNRPKISITS